MQSTLLRFTYVVAQDYKSLFLLGNIYGGGKFATLGRLRSKKTNHQGVARHSIGRLVIRNSTRSIPRLQSREFTFKVYVTRVQINSPVIPIKSDAPRVPAFRNKHLSKLPPKLTPPSEPQITSLVVAKLRNRMLFQEKRTSLNSTVYSEVYPFL